MFKGRRKIIFAGFVAVLISAGIAAQQTDIYFLIKKNFSIYSKTYENVAFDYVDEVNPEVLLRTSLKAMLETLDPYTVVFSESENEQSEIRSRGNYAGVGLDAGFRDGEIVVIAPVDGGPAARAGIRAGDVIVAVDGISTDNLQPEEVSNLLSGEVGSTVELSIQRFGSEQPLDFELKRESIEAKNVTFRDTIGSQKDVGYIKLAQFGMRSAEEIRLSIDSLSKETELSGLILDLRDNPGGILQEAVGIVDKFINPGITVVEIRGRKAEYNEVYKSSEPVMFDKPVVVLMNNGSASASEVVSGALQDLDRAVIVGNKSFGKGLVQIIKPLPYNTSLKITIGRYYIPSGRSIQSISYTHEGRNTAIVNNEEDQREFKTRNGRSVFEGRGIEPDVVTDNRTLGLLESTLYGEGYIFDFATRYEAGHSNYDPDTMLEPAFNEFIAYLNETGFDYTTDAERYLERLREELPSSANVEGQINQLKAAIENEKKQTFEASADQIRSELNLELISRFEGQKGKTRASLDGDADILKALEIIKNPDQYSDILDGN